MKFSINKKNSIGLNVSDYSVKVVELSQKGDDIFVNGFNMVVLESGVVTDGRIKNKEALQKSINEALTNAQLAKDNSEKVYFSLPEKQLYSHIFEIDSSQESDINKLVFEEALASIPLNREDLVFSYKILGKYSKKLSKIEAANLDAAEGKEIEKIKILIVAVDNNVLEEWKIFFNEINIKIENFDIEVLATYRGIFNKYSDRSICLVDIGADKTSISIFSENGLNYSHSITVAGNFFSKKLREGIKRDDSGKDDGYSHKEVGKLKRQIGLLVSEAFSNVGIILKSSLLPVVDEIRVAIKYHNEKTGKIANRIFLVGGSSKIKGLLEYLKSNLSGLKYELTEIGSDGKKVENKKDIEIINGTLFSGKMEIEYATAVGLAMKEFDRDWAKSAAVLPLEFNLSEYGIIPEKTDEKNDEQLEQSEKTEQSTKNKFIKDPKIYVLLGILVVGIFMIGGAFWYRNNEEKKSQAQAEANKTYEKSIEVKVPIGVNKSDYGTDTIKARVYKDVHKEKLSLDELLTKSKELAEKQVKKGEVLWGDNLNELNKDALVCPLTVEWLIYNQKDATVKFMSAGKKIHNNDKDFGYRNIEILKLEKEKNEDLIKYYFSGKVNIVTKEKPVVVDSENKILKNSTSTDEQKNYSESTNQQKENNASSTGANANSIQALSALFAASSGKKFISIDDSGFKQLNVRSEADINSEILGKIYPNNVYELVEDGEEWLRIKYENNNEGWVYKAYAKILE